MNLLTGAIHIKKTNLFMLIVRYPEVNDELFEGFQPVNLVS